MTAMDSVAGEPASHLGVKAPSDGAGGDVLPVKPLLRGWLHLVWFEASLVAGTLALARAHGGVRTAALAVFAPTERDVRGQRAVSPR